MTHRQAMLASLIAYFLWVLCDAATKLGTGIGLTPFVVMAGFGIVSAVGMGSVAVLQRRPEVLWPKTLGAQSSIILCSLVISYVNVLAVKYLPLTVFYIVVFTSPLVIAFLSSLLKHESLTFSKIACLIAGFLGVLLAVAPQEVSGGRGLGYAAALISVLAFAIITVTMRRISQSDSPESIQFVNGVVIGVAGIMGCLIQGTALPEIKILGIMVVVGIINLVGCFLYNVALKHTPSTNVAQLHYTQIISGALLGYLLWHEVPTWNLIAGSLIIIVSGMIVAAKAHTAEPEAPLH